MGSVPALTDIIRYKVLGLRNIMTTAVVVDKGDTVEIRTKRNEYLVFFCLYCGYTAQSAHLGHVEQSQFTLANFFLGRFGPLGN